MKDQEQEGFIVDGGYDYGVANNEVESDYVQDRFCAAVSHVFKHAPISLVKHLYTTKLLPLYSQPCRFYHNILHIEHMFREIDDMKKNYFSDVSPTDEIINDIELTIIAAMYHDAIYVPGSRINEFLSAQLALEHIGNICYNEHTREVDTASSVIVDSILVTRYPCFNKVGYLYEAILHDVDIAILAANKKTYAEYAKNIQKEYEHVISASDFRNGRLQFLSRMIELCNDTCFCTEYFTKKYTARARNNIVSEYNKLLKVK